MYYSISCAYYIYIHRGAVTGHVSDSGTITVSVYTFNKWYMYGIYLYTCYI